MVKRRREYNKGEIIPIVYFLTLNRSNNHSTAPKHKIVQIGDTIEKVLELQQRFRGQSA